MIRDTPDNSINKTNDNVENNKNDKKGGTRKSQKKSKKSSSLSSDDSLSISSSIIEKFMNKRNKKNKRRHNMSSQYYDMQQQNNPMYNNMQQYYPQQQQFMGGLNGMQQPQIPPQYMQPGMSGMPQPYGGNMSYEQQMNMNPINMMNNMMIPGGLHKNLSNEVMDRNGAVLNNDIPHYDKPNLQSNPITFDNEAVRYGSNNMMGNNMMGNNMINPAQMGGSKYFSLEVKGQRKLNNNENKRYNQLGGKSSNNITAMDRISNKVSFPLLPTPLNKTSNIDTNHSIIDNKFYYIEKF